MFYTINSHGSRAFMYINVMWNYLFIYSTLHRLYISVTKYRMQNARLSTTTESAEVQQYL